MHTMSGAYERAVTRYAADGFDRDHTLVHRFRALTASSIIGTDRHDAKAAPAAIAPQAVLDSSVRYSFDVRCGWQKANYCVSWKSAQEDFVMMDGKKFTKEASVVVKAK